MMTLLKPLQHVLLWLEAQPDQTGTSDALGRYLESIRQVRTQQAYGMSMIRLREYGFIDRVGTRQRMAKSTGALMTAQRYRLNDAGRAYLAQLRQAVQPLPKHLQTE